VTDQTAADPALGDGEPVLVATSLALSGPASAAASTWVWFSPLLIWWCRRERRQIRDTARDALGIPLGPLTVLVVTPSRLVFWSTKKVRRRHYHRDQVIGQINRSELAGFSNDTVGQGWRTCRLSLHNGVEVAVRIPARDIDRLLAVLAPVAQA
jgi:hypothetical protein